MNPINQIIAEGKRLCYEADEFHPDEFDSFIRANARFIQFHEPSKMKHLYETLEKAVKLAEHFKDHGHFEYNEEGQEVDVYPAREFLASIEKRWEE